MVADFDVDDYTRWRLLEGFDDIGITLQSGDAIEAFEASTPLVHPDDHGWLSGPWALPAVRFAC